MHIAILKNTGVFVAFQPGFGIAIEINMATRRSCGFRLGNSLVLWFLLFLENPKSQIDKPLRRICRPSTNT